jgi:DNA sulfur modification protein DndD
MQINKAKDQRIELSNKVKSESQKLLEMMTSPHALSAKFADLIFDLKTGLDRVKLPESAAREFFEELSEESECICGRPIDNDIKEVIRTKSIQYLGSDDVSLLNSMKTAIDEEVGRSREKAEDEVKKQIENLEEIVKKERIARNEFDALEASAEQSDPAVKSARDEIEELKKQLNDCEDRLKKFKSEDKDSSDDKIFDLNVIDKRIKEAEDDLAEITKTIELKNKRDILIKILESAHRKAKLGVTKEICNDANIKISELMPYNNIRIEKIDHCLHLEGQSGGSVGEQLSVAYAFLSTLFHRSDHELPFVVDSPAGPIDLDIRPKIGELVPKLSSQFIAFTISTEREGFLPHLKKSSKNSIQYITVFRKGSAELEKVGKSSPNSSESKDGFCVIDEKLFNEFQLESE